MKRKYSKKNQKPIKCFVYLSTDGDENTAPIKEKKQLRYILEYAKAHNLDVIRVYHRDVLGQRDVNGHFMMMVRRIRNKDAKAILLANMGAISTSIPDAYAKIGYVQEAGGRIFTVDEGELSLNLAEIGGLAEC